MTLKKPLPLSEVYRLLEPGPVVLVATALRGRPNVMTMSWHTMLDFEPPLVGCVIGERSRTFAVLRETKELTINIPAAALAKTVVACGNVSGRDVEKFKAYGLTPTPASRVRAPLVGECFAGLECRLIDETLVERYNFFVLEVLAAWIAPARTRARTLHHLGWGRFMVAGKTIALPSKMR